MNCTAVPGGTCTAGYKGLKSFSDFLTPAQVATCNATSIYTWSQQDGFPDPYACVQLAAFYNEPSYCCLFQELYPSPSFLDYAPLANAGSLCSNPNFSTLSCQSFPDPNWPTSPLYNKPEYIGCPNAGILDALTASIVPTNPTTASWGSGLSLAQAFAIAGPFGCYDATPVQNAQLYSQTHQVCPDLDFGFSYSAALSTELTQASWSGQSLTVPCCARLSQTIRTGDSGEVCDAQACFSSPQCSELLREHCSVTANQRDVYCTRWKSWTTNRMFTPTAQCTTSGFPFVSAGSFPSSMDQSMFALLDFCSGNSVTDPDLCAGLKFGLGNNLLFPRVEGVTITDIVPQINSTNTVRTVTFSITNVSNRPFSSLSIFTTNTNYTFTLQTQTLAPTSKTLVTVSTGLSTAVEEANDLYVVSNTITWVGDSFNVDDNCEAVGTFFPSLLTASLSVPQNTDFPVALQCAAGDTEVSYQLFDAGTTTTALAPVLDSATCASLSAQHSATLGATPFPSCSCTSGLGCAGGFEGGCHSSTVVSRQLSSVRVCSTQGWLLSPMYFADTFSWLPNPTSSANTLRQDFPLFGGFQVGFVGNPFNFFLTPTLMVFPLTSNFALG